MEDQIILEKVKNLESAQQAQVLDFIEFLEQKHNRRPSPQFGSGKGTFEMLPDFGEPLDDFKEYQ
ncbi:type II toxin-antitoxin system VapB family antitoxin [Tunicatimonas pelagia]|uniref:type II toxin-antitoxin system VapB family antitoxin n=1 Tax=Tunicatimonas pelagia TaxID=931531 RepID=UPI0026669339|nr:DUF2281 domain-containing protein [Tunicatimonas pelagia]WKN44443.1 DUF2281 domain-containing protein [Tunicatimonas pelagia]